MKDEPAPDREESLRCRGRWPWTPSRTYAGGTGRGHPPTLRRSKGQWPAVHRYEDFSEPNCDQDQLEDAVEDELDVEELLELLEPEAPEVEPSFFDELPESAPLLGAGVASDVLDPSDDLESVLADPARLSVR